MTGTAQAPYSQVGDVIVLMARWSYFRAVQQLLDDRLLYKSMMRQHGIEDQLPQMEKLIQALPRQVDGVLNQFCVEAKQ